MLSSVRTNHGKHQILLQQFGYDGKREQHGRRWYNGTYRQGWHSVHTDFAVNCLPGKQRPGEHRPSPKFNMTAPQQRVVCVLTERCLPGQTILRESYVHAVPVLTTDTIVPAPAILFTLSTLAKLLQEDVVLTIVVNDL